MENTRIRGFIWGVVCVILASVMGALFIRYGLPVVLPFLLSYALSCLIRPAAAFLSGKTGVGRRIWVLLLIAAAVLIISFGLWFLFSVLSREVKDALSVLGELLSDPESSVRKTSDKMMGMLKRANVISGEYSLNAGDILRDALGTLTASLARAVGAVVKGAPSFLFFVVVTVLSLFYFSWDMERIKAEAGRYLPKRVMEGASFWSGVVMRSLARFARAYLLLFCITLCTLYVGFLLMGTEYPFLFALLCSLVDILPVFGVGTVLLPWAAVLLLLGQTGRGIAMIVLLLFIYVLRQILEPRIVGSAAGVHPVLALFAVFLGFRLGGVGGMLAAPLLLNGITLFWEEKKKKRVSKS